MPGKRLTTLELRVLEEVVERLDPGAAPLLSRLPASALTDEEHDRLVSALLDEFAAEGLRDDLEPNEYGLLVEGIIDKLGPWEDSSP
jgi:hypothetical protein